MYLVMLLLFNFVIYSLFGWILENVYCYFIKGHFQKDGFLIGPFKPMYGFALSFLIAFKFIFNPNIFVMSLLCVIIPTTIEYLSGHMLKQNFNKTYWDYSNLKYNFQGLISARFSVYWTILSILTVYYIQPIINSFYYRFITAWVIIIPIITIEILLDLMFRINELKKLEKISEN